MCKYQIKYRLFLLLFLSFVSTVVAQEMPVLSHYISTRHGLSSNIVKCLFKDSNGFLWAGTHQGLNRLDGKNIKSFIHIPVDTTSIKNDQINSICEDEAGRIWVATNAGISILNNYTGKFTNLYSFKYANGNLDISKGVQTLNFFKNKIYFCLQNDSFYSVSTIETPFKITKPILTSHDNINIYKNGIIVNHFGLWILTKDGVIYSDNGTSFYNNDHNTIGLPFLDNDNISAICSDGDSIIYYTTPSYPGIVKYNWETKRTYRNIIKELNNNEVYSIAKAPEGDLWIATAAGILGINTTSWKCYAGDNRINHSPKASLAANELLGDRFGNLFEATDSGLYYGNLNNQLEFHAIQTNDSQACFINPHLPGTVILSVKQSGTDYPLTKETKVVELDYNEKVVTFEFTASNFIDPDETQFAYTLEGYDCDWNYCMNRNTANYINLQEGNYVFKVKAFSQNNNWEGPEEQIAIHVNIAFWKTWWFLSICVAAVCIISFLVYYIRLRQILKIQNLRNKISRDLHDDIGSALSSIAIYGEVAKRYSQENPNQAMHILDNLQETTKSAMENMQDIVWSINPGNDKLRAITDRLQIFGNELLNARGISLDFIVQEDVKNKKLNVQQRNNIYLICKEAINNISKYSDAKKCTLEITYRDKNIQIVICDDGKGMQETKNGLGGNGINNMRTRTQEIGGIFSITSSQNMGTILSIKFPI